MLKRGNSCIIWLNLMSLGHMFLFALGCFGLTVALYIAPQEVPEQNLFLAQSFFGGVGGLFVLCPLISCGAFRKFAEWATYPFSKECRQRKALLQWQKKRKEYVACAIEIEKRLRASGFVGVKITVNESHEEAL